MRIGFSGASPLGLQFLASTAASGFGAQLKTAVSDGSLRLGMRNNAASYSDAVTFSAGGNVGIGTTAPAANLQVSGSFIVSATGQTTTPTLYATTSGQVGVGTNNPNLTGTSTGLTVNGASTVSVELATAGTLRGYISAASNYAQMATSGAYPLLLTTNNTERMRIEASGNVGIGTTAPSKALEVSGTGRFTSNTEVVGTVSATQVKVSSSGDACTAATVGTLRWNAAVGRPEMCFP